MRAGEYDLRPLWRECLNIYQEVAKVCDANGLRYYGNGGTALGCVRHKGFIPWDDDFDISMPRQDYRKFFDIVGKQLPEHLLTEDFMSPTHHYGFREMFGKVYETRPEVIDRVAHDSNLRLGQGIFIDIFPMDGYPRNWFARRFWMFRKTVWRCLTGFGNQPRFLRTMIIPLFKFLYGLGNSKIENARKFERWLMKWDYDKAPLVDDYNMKWKRAKRGPYTKNNFDPAIMMPFEDIKIKMPKDAEYYVASFFGDWRKYPPEEMRRPMHQVLS